MSNCNAITMFRTESIRDNCFVNIQVTITARKEIAEDTFVSTSFLFHLDI